MTRDFYYKNNKIKDGFFPYCKHCAIELTFKNQQKNKALYLKKHRKFDKNKYHSNLEYKLRQNANSEKTRKRGYLITWRKNNKDKVKQYGIARKETKSHQISKSEWNSCLEYFNNSCAYCGMTLDEHKEKYNQQLHKEHVSECGRNDLKNCVPSCKSCNSKKQLTSYNDWYNPKNPVYKKERYSKICKWIKEDCKVYLQEKNFKLNNIIKEERLL